MENQKSKKIVNVIGDQNEKRFILIIQKLQDTSFVQTFKTCHRINQRDGTTRLQTPEEINGNLPDYTIEEIIQMINAPHVTQVQIRKVKAKLRYFKNLQKREKEYQANYNVFQK